MGEYINTQDHAAHIRATLKAKHKITSRQVSVRSNLYSMGSSIDITVHDPCVSAKLVESIASPAERIDRDSYGEILSGGNRFVHVRYSQEALEIIGQRYLAVVQAAAAELATHGATSSSLIPIAGTPLLLGRGSHTWGFSVWEDAHLQNSDSVEGIARAVGCLMLERGKKPPRVETTPKPSLTLVPLPAVEVPHTYGCQAAALLGHPCCCPRSLTPHVTKEG